MARRMFALMLSTVVAATVGCSGGESTTPQQSETPELTTVMFANSVCPISGEAELVEKQEWNQQTVGFCCSECASKWASLTDDEKTTKLASAK